MSTVEASKENPWEDVKGNLGGTLTTVAHHESYPAISPARPELSQAGRTVLVVGGSTGIGYSIGESFAAAGAARVILTGRRPEALNEAVSKITSQYPKVEVVGKVNDYGDHDAVDKLWSGFAQDGIFVDVLVLSASKMWLPNTLLGLGTETIKEGFAFNVVTPYFWTEHFHKQREQDSSRKLVCCHPLISDAELIQSVPRCSSTSRLPWLTCRPLPRPCCSMPSRRAPRP